MLIFNALQTSLNGGIGRYSYELAKTLYAIEEDMKIVIRDVDFEKYNFVNPEDLIIISGINNSKQRNFFEQFKLPRIIYKKYPNAIIHFPDTMAPLLSKNPVVITVHDLAFKSVKGAFTPSSTLWKNIITNLSIRKASKIISITNFTKEEINKHYPNIDNNKIYVVHNGFNNFSFEKCKMELIRDEIKDSCKDYIFTVSTISPRKNIDGLIRAFNLIKNEINMDLVIAGANGWMYEDVYRSVEELNIQDRVKFLGKVNDEELKYLYKNTKLFAYVSFYEGFGLPPLEAMSFNTPCLVSNVSSLPEVVGDYATLVNPYDIEDIATNILNCLKDKSEKNYTLHLEKFSWEKCAKETSLVYHTR